MPYGQPSITSISGNRDIPMHIDGADLNTRVSYPQGGFSTQSISGTDVGRFAGSVGGESILEQLNRVQTPPPPKNFFGAKVCIENRAALCDMRYLIKELGCTIVELGGEVPKFKILEIRGPNSYNKSMISDNLHIFNEDAMIRDMQYIYNTKHFYSKTAPIYGQTNSVFQHAYM